ncbi:hypothetical protein [Streptomyces sp. NPDC101237]|uniref:hypothetical protein n=1 Tax=Streptomyces sp. NPDC101237 TaxID=3366139 RepID=UPI0037F66801
MRKAVPGNRRVRAVEITAAGRELFDAAHVAAAPLADELTVDFEPGEAALLMDMLSRIAYPGRAD